MSEISALRNGSTARRLTVWRTLAWGLTVAGVWLFWAYRCYKHHDFGMPLEPFIRDVAWGGLPTLFLAIVLPIATRRFDAVESPEEPGWKKWSRLLVCLFWAGVVGFAIFGLITCGMLVKFAMEPWGAFQG